MVDHQYCDFAFVVKEGGTGETWIALEPQGKLPSCLKGWHLGFDLPDGTSYDRATEIATFLKNNLGPLMLTGAILPPHEESSTQH